MKKELGNAGCVPPVKVGDELELEIISIGTSGDGLAKVEGYCIFVPNAQQGERVWVKIMKVRAKVGFAKIVEVPK